ncbi:MAG: radical SAM protein [Candidatus Thorarchaeota archaeon]
MKILKGDDVCGVRAPGYNYIFRKSDGFAMRWGKTKDDDPFWGPSPELADISISNRCSNGCSFCYRDSEPEGPLMSVDDFRLVMQQLPATFQLALGGGEPTEHPDFIEFLKISREYGKVPNYTTNGTRLTQEIIEATKKYCGAVAVSWSDIALEAVDKFVKGGVKTNIHFILSPSTIQQGIELMKKPELFGEDGINAVVFLLHKAIGRGQTEDTPTAEQTKPLVVEAFSTEVSVAFDVCAIPHIAAAEKAGAIEVDWDLLDFCDGSRFTVYVDEDLNVSPCSFIKGNQFTESLREMNMNKIWNGEKFSKFRKILKDEPQACPAILIE